MRQTNETTDMTLFVKTSHEYTTRWDRQKIVDALMRETNVDLETAEAISKEVEKQIISSGITVLTTPLIRELVDAKLVERGLEQPRRMHALLGFPIYDVKQLIFHQNKENANLPHGPEGTNLLLAEAIKRDYSLHDVFSQDVADAHAAGDIHIHGLGFIDRPYSSSQSLEYIKKYGLNLPHSLNVAKPAKHAEVILAHMVRFGAILQGHFAGVISWDAINLSLAPYLSKMTDREIRQFAQMLIYEFSQLTSARGGQSMFTDVHLYWEIPDHLIGAKIVGPGGEITGYSYENYINEARRFALAIFEVFKKGDGAGNPFIFPRPVVHISESFFQSPGYNEFLDIISEVAAEKGNTCFALDRKEKTKICQHLMIDDQIEPWKVRSSVMQNVTLNLPRIAYQARGNDGDLFSIIKERMELIAKAHTQKKLFIEKLLSLGDDGPLAMLAMEKDGLPYLIMERATYHIGLLGLNELVQIHKGKQLHESDAAISFGLKTISFMGEQAAKLSDQHDMRFALEQTHAETTAYRFARLDLKYFSPEAGHFVKGNIARGEIYYTNSTHLNVSAPVDPMERITKEGLFHPLIEGGAASHIWLGEIRPAKNQIAEFIVTAFNNTINKHILFSPSITNCKACKITSAGSKEMCPFCGSSDVDGIARITQYFSKLSSWNKGKLAELRDRKQAVF